MLLLVLHGVRELQLQDSISHAIKAGGNIVPILTMVPDCNFHGAIGWVQ